MYLAMFGYMFFQQIILWMNWIPPCSTFLILNHVYTDINELNLPKTCQMEFPDQDDLLNFKLIISPDEVR